MHPLDKIEEMTGSRARSLHGALCDPARPSSSSCPNRISEIVAKYYAITECGRLFHWRFREIRELTIIEGRFEVKANGNQWKINAEDLRDRVFPRRRIDDEVQAIDWSDYDPDLPIPGIRETEKNKRFDGSKLLDRPPTTGEWERVWPIFYGQM